MTTSTSLEKRPKDHPESSADHMQELIEIMRRLRDRETGCPWDIEQDFHTIAPYTIEEAYEVADAIENRDWNGLRGELGDLLLQSVFHAQIADEKGLFCFDDVVKGISQKLIARHPHVFGENHVKKTAEDQIRDWEAIKAQERAQGKAKGALDGVAQALPALTRALKLQERAARVGFDWPETRNVLSKMIEEAAELIEAREFMSPEDVAGEMGDLLFVMANLARHLEVDPEAALRRTNRKFERRFRAIEAHLAREGRKAEDCTLSELDMLWDRVKDEESSEPGQGDTAAP